jgi:hypothetical protein
MAADARSTADVFAGPAVARLSIRAPLSTLFARAAKDESFDVPATIAFASSPGDPLEALGKTTLAVRGNTSRRDCTFAKLDVRFKDHDGPAADLRGLKVNTHCGEAPDGTLTRKYGRLANEKSPWREGLVYALLDAAGVRTARTRLARITYVDTSNENDPPITRNALLIENDDDMQRRLGAGSQLDRDEFTTADRMLDPDETARIAFAEVMVGNFDWCLRMRAGDEYRCDDSKGLWNIVALKTDGGIVPVMEDFDLAGIVTGRHVWFPHVFSAAFGGSAIATEVVAQVQRARTLFDRTRLDRMRRDFLARRARLYAVVASATVDADGRQLARQYLDAFYRAIETDEAFYRPVIVRPRVHVYTDAAATQEACGAGDIAPVGTPVNVIGRQGDMAKVRLLDALWRWAPPTECAAVHQNAVWIDGAAIGTDLPK